MAGVVYITQADIEARFPTSHVGAVWSNDGSGTPDATRLAKSCSVASRQGDSELMKAWTPDQIPTLVAEDDAVKDALCDLAMAHGVKGKPEWSGEGAPYAGLRKAALEMLAKLASAQLRSRAEPLAGANPNRRGRITSADSPQFVFAPNAARPRPGGY